MSTHNICFYEELEKIIPELSSNIPLEQVLWDKNSIMACLSPIMYNFSQIKTHALQQCSFQVFLPLRNLECIMELIVIHEA